MNKIFNMDCIAGMKNNIMDNSVNMIVTSPPYNVGIKYDEYNDNITEEEYWYFTKMWITESYRVLCKGGRICINIPVMGNNSIIKKSKKFIFYLPHYTSILEELFTLRECITWIKSYKENDENSFCGNNTAWGSWCSPSSPYLRSFSEFIIIAQKEDPFLHHKGVTDITKDEFLKWTKNVWFMPACTKKTHPAVFPIELPIRCIKLYSYINDIVMDPFAGSGTTIEACIRLNRKYIGFEISTIYYELIKSIVAQKQLI